MSVAHPEATPRGTRRSRRFRAFGIDIESTVPLALGRGASTDARATTLEVESTRELSRMWSASPSTTVLERRRVDGRLVMSVDHAPALGYLVDAPRNGRHHVTPDGARIRSALPRTAPWRWQRLLFAQVLPLAATLRGMELLHASAVEYGGRAFAFVAGSGTGKTSVAAHVVASGGRFLTDDVLALEVVDASVVAHPGAATVSIGADELGRMSSRQQRRIGRPVGRSDKIIIRAKVADAPAPVESLYFLERPTSGHLTIDVLEPDPVRVLGNSFNTYVATPERIVNQLAIAARLAESVGMLSVKIPEGSPASEVARAVVEHAQIA